MAPNFIACDREQDLLLPPSLREWPPADHLVWFVLDVVGAMDLDAFVSVYRRDGQGCPAHDPAMMVALVVCAYSRGQRRRGGGSSGPASRTARSGSLPRTGFRITRRSPG